LQTTRLEHSTTTCRNGISDIELAAGILFSCALFGFLTGKIDVSTKFESTDFRAVFPRFTEEARSANLAVVDLLKQIAQRENATPAQIALAWLLAQRPWIVPIPGTTKVHRLEENIGSASVELKSEDVDEINTAASRIPIQGERLPESILRMSYR
jgi:aryl-alcohol dehydrogenase-like predicted oxidoreductase